MFGFSKKKEPVVPVVPEPKQLRFYAYGNSLCQVGKAPWPPVLRDTAPYDRSDLFRLIADALNVRGRYGFLREQMEKSVTAYKRGDMDKQQLADDLLKMFRVIQNDEQQEASRLREHDRQLAEYERSNGNWGG